jgi:hypothetical protein
MIESDRLALLEGPKSLILSGQRQKKSPEFVQVESFIEPTPEQYTEINVHEEAAPALSGMFFWNYLRTACFNCNL